MKPSMRAAKIILEYGSAKSGRTKKNSTGDCGLTAEEAAKMAGVSTRLIKLTRKAIRDGFVDEVTTGVACSKHAKHYRNAMSGVYFCTAGPFVKIGYSKNIQRRVLDFETGCPYPLNVVAVIENASCSDEKELHRKFSHLHYHREWFFDSSELSDFIFNLQEKLNA